MRARWRLTVVAFGHHGRSYEVHIAPPLVPAVAEFVFSLTSYHTTRHGVPRFPELRRFHRGTCKCAHRPTDDAMRRPTLISRLSIPYLSNEQTDGDNGNVARSAPPPAERESATGTPSTSGIIAWSAGLLLFIWPPSLSLARRDCR